MCTTFIRRHIYLLPVGQLFTTRDMLVYGTRTGVDQALSRLVKRGVILRLARGVFARQGSCMPSVFEVAVTKARAFGKAIARHAADLAREAGLTAAAHPQSIFSVIGSSSSFLYGSIRIRLRAAAPRKIRLADRKSGQAIRALWHLGRFACTPGAIMAATQSFGRSDREEVRQSARWMPAWLSDQFYAGRYPTRRERLPGELIPEPC